MTKTPSKAQLLRAMNAIHARLEAVTYKDSGPGNVWETIGGIQYWVEETLGKEVKTMRDAQREGMERALSKNSLSSVDPPPVTP
jgi:hypothetical protein